jgi:hypothetical protein
MKKVIFAWQWVGTWPEYTLDGEPFWALINPRIWDRHVSSNKSGSIEITMDELFEYIL